MVGPSAEELRRRARFENDLWHAIRVKSANDPVLKEILESAILYFRLKYDEPIPRTVGDYDPYKIKFDL